ncbi:CP family cyanate transporter-like MFS transporter [Pseudomonas psychrotolerans]|uniref:CP family cyanate transporter-like MFS transporter n=1 Tax=Pseudomonas oryzihabitans TaxID=47885 RepID=A0AAJ2BJ92_9PSED|nr:CP family cyanate transporter-like MFS transporter [Pseudomonas psychrotolerans]MDR6355478.1 CP family cyanate transporter-like MFS transporter [Pseudomonas psychrotolerans]
MLSASPSSPTVASPRQDACLAVLLVLLVGLNLRPILAAIGPLLDGIQVATGLDGSAAGALTTLPIAAMGLCALGGARLQAWLGERRGIALGLLLLALANAVRWDEPSGLGLILTAGLGGVGIALVQALIPAYIRRCYPQRTSTLMGLYTTGIMGGAALAAATAAPLAEQLGWAPGLALWTLPVLLALVTWLALARPDAPVSTAVPRAQPWRSRQAWVLLAFFGIGTSAYTLVLAWLPPYYTGLGWQPVDSGLLLGGLSLAEVSAGLLLSATIARLRNRRPLVLGVLGVVLVGLLGLALVPLQLALPIALLLGLGIGTLFPLSLILAMDQVRDPGEAGALLGFVQGGGYLIASLAPLAAGILRDQLDSLANAWLLMAVGVVLLMGLGLHLTRTERVVGLAPCHEA